MLVLIKFLFFFKFLISPDRYNYLYSYMIYLSKDIIVLLSHCSIKGFFPVSWLRLRTLSGKLWGALTHFGGDMDLIGLLLLKVPFLTPDYLYNSNRWCESATFLLPGKRKVKELTNLEESCRLVNVWEKWAKIYFLPSSLVWQHGNI